MAWADGSYRLVPHSFSLEITAQAPGHSFVVKSQTAEVALTIAEGQLSRMEAQLGLNSLQAKDALGQRELKKYLKLEQNPVGKAVLMTPTGLEKGAAPRLNFWVEAPGPGQKAEVPVKVVRAEDEIELSAQLLFSQLGYKPPRLLLFKVKDALSLQIKLRLEAQQG